MHRCISFVVLQGARSLVSQNRIQRGLTKFFFLFYSLLCQDCFHSCNLVKEAGLFWIQILLETFKTFNINH